MCTRDQCCTHEEINFDQNVFHHRVPKGTCSEWGPKKKRLRKRDTLMGEKHHFCPNPKICYTLKQKGSSCCPCRASYEFCNIRHLYVDLSGGNFVSLAMCWFAKNPCPGGPVVLCCFAPHASDTNVMPPRLTTSSSSPRRLNVPAPEIQTGDGTTPDVGHEEPPSVADATPV